MARQAGQDNATSVMARAKARPDKRRLKQKPPTFGEATLLLRRARAALARAGTDTVAIGEAAEQAWRAARVAARQVLRCHGQDGRDREGVIPRAIALIPPAAGVVFGDAQLVLHGGGFFEPDEARHTARYLEAKMAALEDVFAQLPAWCPRPPRPSGKVRR